MIRSIKNPIRQITDNRIDPLNLGTPKPDLIFIELAPDQGEKIEIHGRAMTQAQCQGRTAVEREDFRRSCKLRPELALRRRQRR